MIRSSISIFILCVFQTISAQNNSETTQSQGILDFLIVKQNIVVVKNLSKFNLALLRLLLSYDWKFNNKQFNAWYKCFFWFNNLKFNKSWTRRWKNGWTWQRGSSDGYFDSYCWCFTTSLHNFGNLIMLL